MGVLVVCGRESFGLARRDGARLRLFCELKGKRFAVVIVIGHFNKFFVGAGFSDLRPHEVVVIAGRPAPDYSKVVDKVDWLDATDGETLTLVVARYPLEPSAG